MILTQYIGGRSWREQGHTILGPKKALAGLSCSQEKHQLYNIQYADVFEMHVCASKYLSRAHISIP